MPEKAYTQAGLRFQLMKTARYFRLYGVFHVFAMIKAQYHVKAEAMPGFAGDRWVNPNCKSPGATTRNIAIIGAGKYAYAFIAFFLKKRNRRFLRCVYSPGKKSAISLCRAYGGAYVPLEWGAILADPQVRLVFIASNPASHTAYAIACLRAGKHVHIEKPHVTSRAELSALLESMRSNPGSKVLLGFNRPRSVLIGRLRKGLDAEPGPLAMNWFVAIHGPDDGAGAGDPECGGPVLTHLCHCSDLALHLVTMERAFPCVVIPAVPDGPRSGFSVTIVFADGSYSSITFSAKGHVFSGHHEVLNVHKGSLLARLENYEYLEMEIAGERKRFRLSHRDHGHAANIAHSASAALDGSEEGESRQYISATAMLFLAVQEAVNSRKTVRLSCEEALDGPGEARGFPETSDTRA